MTAAKPQTKGESQRLVVSRKLLQASLARVVKAISAWDPQDLVIILDGGCALGMDVLRHLPHLRTYFVKVTRYGSAREPLHEPKLVIRGDLPQRPCLIVDDIYDSGKTLRRVRSELPAGSRSLVAVYREPQKATDAGPDYFLTRAPGAPAKAFFYGYGMDLAGRYRGLKDIFYV